MSGPLIGKADEPRRTVGADQLDFRFEQCGPGAFANRPSRGWIRAVRDAVAMTGAQLSLRMGTSQLAVAHLERPMAEGQIRLESPRRAADALCGDVLNADPVELRRRADRHATELIASGRLWDTPP